MTCKFCGSYLEDGVEECPYCGHSVESALKTEPAEEDISLNSVEDDYADLNLDEEPTADVDESEEEYEAEEAEEPRTRSHAKKASDAAAKAQEMFARIGAKASQSASAAKKAAARSSGQRQINPNMILLITAIVCFLIVLISLITAIGTKNKVEDMYQDMLSQFYQLQNEYDQLSSQISGMNTTVSAVNTTLDEQSISRYITITKQPSAASTYIGRTGNIPIFTVTAEGNNLSFTWQKFDNSSGSWVSITWDEDSNNTTYGIHLYTDVSKGYSELAANNVTSAAYGTYRCVITDDYGSVQTDSVTLTERAQS